MQRGKSERGMEEIAAGVWLLTGRPRHAVNVYLAGDVLIDTGTRWARSRLSRQLAGRDLSLIALTHCHPDHQGSARWLCERFQAPLACHEADVAALEGRAPMLPDNWVLRQGIRLFGGPPAKVDRVLSEGDELAGFRVVHAPGHTPGHVFYFRESDRLAIAGDVLANISFLTWRPGLRQPPRVFSADAAENLRSLRRLIELRPRVVCFGHGPPLRDMAALEALAARLCGPV